MSELIQQIRQRDYDRYACSLCAPRPVQAGLMALIAFNSEIAPVAEQVSEPMIGMIRLAWWREALDEIYTGKTPRQHTVVEALAETIRHYQLPRQPFDDLLQGRAQDVENKQGIATQEAFLSYLDMTVTPLHSLMAMVSGQVTPDVRATSHRYGIIGLLRALPVHVESGIIRFPLSVMQSHGIAPEAITLGLETERLNAFVKYMTDEALAYAAPAASASHIIKLMDVVALSYASALKKGDYQLSQLPVRLPQLPLKLWWKSLF